MVAIAEQGIRVVQHAHFAHALYSLIGKHTHKGQIAPCRPHHCHFDINNFHQTSAYGYPHVHAWGGSRRSLFRAGVGPA